MPRVLHAASELFPLVKTGGLADVAAALPPALARNGVDARVLVPGYPAVMAAAERMEPVARLADRFGAGQAWLLAGTLRDVGVRAYVIDAPDLFDRPGGPYSDEHGHERRDNWARFALLGRAAADLAAGADPAWRPDIVHAHDWQAGLAPAYMRADGTIGVASLITVHNLAYQGNSPPSVFDRLGLPAGYFTVEGAEFYGQVSYLKAGLMFADRISTVSRTYAEEIQTQEGGFGLDGVLRARSGVLSGIVNGIDTNVWDPARDLHLPTSYSRHAMAGKAVARRTLAAELGIAPPPRGPIFGVVSRLTPLKGLDLLLAAVDELIAADGALALLGAGDAELEAYFLAAQDRHPGRIGVRLGYDEALAHRIIAGCDIVLVPSRAEPCGLTQLYGLRYGSLPLVRRTGGLADTVVNADPADRAAGTATGFVFDDATPEALAGTLAWAAELFADQQAWQAMQQTAMAVPVGWDRAARDYAALYAGMLA